MHVLCVGDVQREVNAVAEELRKRGVEVTAGYGRKDERAIKAITSARELQIAAVIIVCRRDPDEEIRWECWCHRAKGGIAVNWKYCD